MPSGTSSKWIILAALTKIIKIALTCDFCNLSCARENSFNDIPWCVVSFHFRIETKTRTFITSHNSLQNVMIFVNNLDEIETTFNLMLSLFSPKGAWHKPQTNLRFLQISFKNLPGHFLTNSKICSK